MPGPPPKRTRSRARDAKRSGEFRTLETRTGSVPDWPLLPDVSLTAELELGESRIANLQDEFDQTEDGRTRGRVKRELNKLEMSTAKLRIQVEQAEVSERQLWDYLWRTPQAVLWEETHALREVAQYVRWKIRAEQGDVKAASEARQLSDRLGLNPLALMRLRAEVMSVDEAEAKASNTTPVKATPKKKQDDPRGFLTAVS